MLFHKGVHIPHGLSNVELITVLTTNTVISVILSNNSMSLKLAQMSVLDLSLIPPPPFLTCCVILPTSFGGKGPHLR